MEKFPDLLPQLGMKLQNTKIPDCHTIIVTVWEDDAIVCVGVGSDIADALRRAEPWFWQEMVDRKLAQLL
jgi:hypothetical protein